MRAFTATLGTETNSFSPIPTGMAAFRSTMLWRPGQHPDFPTEATGPLWALRGRVGRGWDVVEGTCAFAMPGGPVARDVYELLRDEILDQLRAAMPVDLVALGLHGAMMAHGYPDCEGDLLARVREMVGSTVPVGAVFDPHAHIGSAMVNSADVLIAFKHYPHDDYVARSEELLDLLAAMVRGERRPVMAWARAGLIAGFRSDAEPGAGLVQALREAERGPILSASYVHGFGLGDSPDLGSGALVVADGDFVAAQRAADQLAAALSILKKPACVPESVETVLREAQLASSPAIVVDSADQPGGGGAGDNMAVAHAARAIGATGVVMGPIWDPQAVSFCQQAGVGAKLSLRIGGKATAESGLPFDVDCAVVGLCAAATQKLGEAVVPIGDAAGVTSDGISILLTTLRDQAYDPDLFRAVGLDPAAADVLVLKSSAQFRLGFGGLAGDILPLARGPHMVDRPFRHRPHPLWPFEDVA